MRLRADTVLDWINMISKAFSPDGKTWGANIIHKTDKDLPGLKFLFLSESLRNVDGSVLEVGCSAGKHLRSLLAIKQDITCSGLDIDENSVNLGHGISPEIDFVIGDGLNLPYKAGAFDAVTIMDFLEHVPDPDRAIEQIIWALKAGGIIIAFVPCEGNKLSFYYLFYRIFGFNVKGTTGGHVQLFTSNELLDLMLKKGMKVVRVRYSYHLLGALLDFTLFLMMHLSRRVFNLYWSANKYYQNETRAWNSLQSRLFNSTLKVTNLIAYCESQLLNRVKAFACGVHFVVVKYSD